MSSDVEMLEVQEITKKSQTSPHQLRPLARSTSISSTSPPPSSRNSSVAFPSHNKDNNNTDNDTTDNEHNNNISISSRAQSPDHLIAIPVLIANHSADDKNSKPSPSTGASVSTSTKPSSTKPASTAKPKSTKPKPRSPSPSPPPPPPPPLQTIRLDITLGGPDNYEVDIASIAKATGQRPPTPVPIKRDTSDSEGEDEPDGKDKVTTDKPKSKKKKKNAGAEYYDIHDPFIDDSELAIDERTFFAQTKQQGFYVSSGEVALLKDNTPKKPKSKKPPAGASAEAGPSNLALSAIKQEGTKDSPIALTSDAEEDKIGQKRKRYVTVVENGKKRKIVDVHSFHPDLQASIDVLKAAIAKESWETKGKFPPSIKPILAQVAVQAIKLGEYDEHFFNLMPVLFPYNKFTMSKLIRRTVFQDHTQFLMARQEELLEELAAQTKAGFSKAEEEWEKSVVAWDKRQEKARAEASATAADPNADGTAGVPSRHPTEDAGSGMEVDPPGGGGGQDKDGASHEGAGEKDKDAAGKDGNKEPHPPSKKYRMTESMKSIVWELVTLSNECCRLENEKNTLEGSVLQVSEQGLRKVLYQKIVAAFPAGWMSSGQISRDVSSMKKKYEKEAMENEA